MRHFRLLLCVPAVFFLLAIQNLMAAQQAEDFNVEIGDQELQLKRFPATGDHLILWLSPGFGRPDREFALASALAKRGVEVWYLDLVESLFLPRSTSTLRAMDGRYVAGLISAAHEKTGKQIIVASRAYGSLPVLRGARLWQQKFFAPASSPQKSYFSGAILFSPELHGRTVELGLEPVYDPIADATNIPVMLYQSGRRGNRWQLEKTLSHLESGGAQVFLKLLPGVTGVFYDEDKAPSTLAVLSSLPDEIVRVLRTLDSTTMPNKVLPLANIQIPDEGGRDIRLTPFHGNPVPPDLSLENSHGEIFVHDNYHGKVTLVNFWASWCGPCVEEIPSLNNLREKMQGRPFELISVNYAEDKKRISAFLKKVQVDFPVLLDHDGQVAAKWNVLVFPATFVIGPDGEIKYGVNGGIYWDSPDVIEKLENLMQQTH